MRINQSNADQEQMTRYANLRDEISLIRKVEKAKHIWSATSFLTLGSDLEPFWSGLQGAQPRDVHKVGHLLQARQYV